MGMLHRLTLGLVLVALAGMAEAQSRTETLADIRQQLTMMHVEMQRLTTELSTTGAAQPQGGGETQLQRLDALEGELRRITGKVEELEYRIERIVRDGTNRIADLEYRLVELEGGDVSKLKEGTTLGGDAKKTPLVNVLPPVSTGSELAVSEQVDFETAKDAYDDQDFERAAELFAGFVENYPGGPMNGDAHFWRGESLSELGEWSAAARSYLQSFSSAPDSDVAPRALFKLGVSLDRIGQREEACLTLNEVGIRYPDSEAAGLADSEMSRMKCTS